MLSRPARVRFLSGEAADRIQARRDAATLAAYLESAQRLESAGLIHAAADRGLSGLATVAAAARAYRRSQRAA